MCSLQIRVWLRVFRTFELLSAPYRDNAGVAGQSGTFSRCETRRKSTATPRSYPAMPYRA
jgi:hypothetical protein